MEGIDQSHHLVNLACNYRVCRKCRFVNKTSVAHTQNITCPSCGFEDSSTPFFFDFSIFIVIDLMQEAYRTSLVIPDASLILGISAKSAQNASVVIFFCTIKELLLERFLSNLLRCFSMPTSLIRKIETDHNIHSKRLNKLFPALIGQNWQDVIASLSSSEHDYVSLNIFIERVVKERNNLLHEGDHFGMDNDIAKECLDNFVPMLDLFVLLHNCYTHAISKGFIK
jgi:RNA polymerase subunit RPABC4/transcription elongation factor Spt4